MPRTRYATAIIAIGLFFSVAALSVGHGDDKHDADITLTGEILDLHCYMLHPETGQGTEHAKCANSCIDRGLAAGFLADGRVYLLLGPGHEAPAELVSGQAGQPVQLTGKLVEHGGMRAIQVKSVKAGGGASAGSSQTKPSAAHQHKH